MSDYQDVESEEESQLCNSDQDICYGSLIVTNVNLTLNDGGVVDLVEVQISKGCGRSVDFNQSDYNLGVYSASRKCWTTNVKDENVVLSNTGYNTNGCFIDLLTYTNMTLVPPRS